jgi:hypothetical protein
MNCAALTTGFIALAQRAALAPLWCVLTGMEDRTPWARWPWINGGHVLFRGPTAESIGFDSPVGFSAAGSTITEFLDRPITDGDLFYALRAVGPSGALDEADPPTTTQVTLVAGVVQLPAPLAPGVWQVEPLSGGRFAVTAVINNVGASTPTRALQVYTDQGTGGGVNYAQPVGAPIAVGSLFGTYRQVIDPNLPHGTVLEVGLRATSADAVEETNTETRTVTLDAEAPATPAGVTVEAVCD